VHHAVATSEDPRSLELVAFRRSGALVIEVRDDGPGLLPGALERRRDAIGLKTTRSRLEHLYGTAFNFTVQNRATGGTVAQVVVPLRPDFSADLRMPQVA
jgi:sensor histidine kinase YesM